MSFSLGFDKKRADLFHCQWMMSLGFSRSLLQTCYTCLLNACPGVGVSQSELDYFNQQMQQYGINCGQYTHTYTHTLSRAHAHTHAHSCTHAPLPPPHTLFLSLSRPDITAMVDWALKPIFSFLPTFSLLLLPPTLPSTTLSFELAYLVRSKSHAS